MPRRPRSCSASTRRPRRNTRRSSRGDEPAADAQLDPRLQRQVVNYATNEAPGTVIVDTPHTFLYFVLGNGKAMRYGIGVGREGFTWAGVKQVAKKAEWPDWYPPQEMIARQPYLPRMIAGGPGNPLGARAMYLGGSEYRIHGTNDPATIGKHVSQRLHPPHQRGRERSLQPRAGRRESDRAAAERAGADRADGAEAMSHERMSWKVDGRPASTDFSETSNDWPGHRAGPFFCIDPVKRGALTAASPRLRNIAQGAPIACITGTRFGLKPRARRVFQIGAEIARARDQRRAEGAGACS